PQGPPRSLCRHPGVLEHGGAYCRGEVEPGAGPVTFIEAREDAERLRIAFKALVEPEPLPRKPVEGLFPKVAKGRVTQIVGARGTLNNNGVTSAKLFH